MTQQIHFAPGELRSLAHHALKTANRKWLVLWLARRYCGMTLRELGTQMGGMDSSAVSMGLVRFERRLRRRGALVRQCRDIGEMLNVET